MPRRARITLAGVPHHIIQRGNNHGICFHCVEDRLNYLAWLEEYAQLTGCEIHAFVLMTNHVHLLLTPEHSHSTGQLMKMLGQRYVQYFNRRYERSGTLWEGRYRSTIAGEASYIFSCYRYIELNPVRANMVDDPGKYAWSSYRANALGEPSSLVSPHGLYMGLASSDAQRQLAYRGSFGSQLGDDLVNEIRSATNGNFALGTEQFSAQIEVDLGIRATPGVSGRPSRKAK